MIVSAHRPHQPAMLAVLTGCCHKLHPRDYTRVQGTRPEVPSLFFTQSIPLIIVELGSAKRHVPGCVAIGSPQDAAGRVFCLEDGTMRNQKGFSLIELLIVVAIILTIAAIAIPNLMRSRMRANEANAVASLRVIHTAAVTYDTTYPALGFPTSLLVLAGPNPCTIPSSTQACLVDSVLAAGVKDGYNFVWTGDGIVPSFSFTIGAAPQAAGSSGQNMYCTDQTGVIRYDPTGSNCTNGSLAIN